MKNDWVEESLLLMHNGKTKEALSIVKKMLPPKLYKYQRLDENGYTLDNLEKQQFHLCNIENFNDPYECKATINFNLYFIKVVESTYPTLANHGIHFEEGEKITIQKSEDSFKEFKGLCDKKGIPFSWDKEKIMEAQFAETEKSFQLLRDYTRFYSFTERSDSTVMWSHYSDTHKGICIEYNTDDFDFRSPIFKVLYSQDRYDMTEFPDHDNGSVKSHSMLYNAYLTKAEDWSYEKEWRLIYNLMPHEMGQKSITIASPKPSKIYLGSYFDKNEKEKKDRLISISNQHNIPTAQMKLDNTKFRMIPKSAT